MPVNIQLPADPVSVGAMIERYDRKRAMLIAFNHVPADAGSVELPSTDRSIFLAGRMHVNQ